MRASLFLTIWVSLFWSPSSSTYTIDLENSNIDNILQSNELVFINFYANWCRFSQMLKPIWEETALAAKTEFTEPGKVVIAQVDCDRSSDIAQKYSISKYPTLKLIRNGKVAKREYRAQRSKDAFIEFLKQQLKDPVIQMQAGQSIDTVDKTKMAVVGYFRDVNSGDYQGFKKAATALRDNCNFYAGIGETFNEELIPGNNVVFRPARTDGDEDILFMGSLADGDMLLAWATDKCVPLVREITFENGEELTEEGLPFLILFHHPDDQETVRKYKDVVARELLYEKNKINFLTADGTKFTHPLHHLQKTPKDLPLISIDSFRHMYLFPDMSQLTVPGKLKTFVQDLHSGKLHREFHHGPDPVQTEVATQETKKTKEEAKKTDPPESMFVKLKPSEHRYTLLRDEL